LEGYQTPPGDPRFRSAEARARRLEVSSFRGTIAATWHSGPSAWQLRRAASSRPAAWAQQQASMPRPTSDRRVAEPPRAPWRCEAA